jgi:uncharacterized membrane protein YuzA (DUF378 family)
MEDESSLWILDFPTLVLIIFAGFQLGLQGFFGINAAGWLFGNGVKVFYMLIGLSALWQLMRQRFH